MKKLHVLTLVILLAAFAAADTHAQGTRIGLGVGIAGYGDGSAIYVPIDLGSFRIEPHIGLFRRSMESGNVEQSQTSIALGTGIFAEGATVANTVIYYGGRLGIAQNSQSVETPAGESDESTTDFFLGPAVGAEYYFSERFSIGGEAQLFFTSFGEEDDDSDVSSSQLQTQGVLFVRWYF